MGSGPSRELLELWAPDSRNGVIVTGYSIEGTMARVSTQAFTLVAHLYITWKRINVSFFISSSRILSNQHEYFAYFLGIIQDIQSEPDDFESIHGGTIQRKMSVDELSFAAHVDYSQNSEFIELVKAQHVVRLQFFLQVFEFQADFIYSL